MIAIIIQTKFDYATWENFSLKSKPSTCENLLKRNKCNSLQESNSHIKHFTAKCKVRKLIVLWFKNFKSSKVIAWPMIIYQFLSGTIYILWFLHYNRWKCLWFLQWNWILYTITKFNSIKGIKGILLNKCFIGNVYCHKNPIWIQVDIANTITFTQRLWFNIMWHYNTNYAF